MECGVPECGNQRFNNIGRKVEPIDDNDRKHVLNVVHKSREHPHENCPDEEKWRVNPNLMDQSSRSLVFPNHIEVRFEASECKDERDEKAARADDPQFCDGDVLRVFDEVHDLLGRPVQIEHVDHDGEVVRDKVAESDCKRNRSEHDKQRDNSHKCRIGQRSGTSHSVVIQERLSGDDHYFYKCWRTVSEAIEQPFPRKIFPPMRHIHRKYS